MSELTRDEIEKLNIMFDGDKSRDASSKIRGFLFQDYVAIMCLLQDEAEYVCSEFIEDVDVFYKDGTFEFIQVKYYPNTSPDKEEISTDLYYQFLRMKMLHSDMQTNPKLYIHRNSIVIAPTVDEMKQYVGLGNKLKLTVEYPDVAASEKWLRENVYVESKKKNQKNILFGEMASEDSINEFISKMRVTHQVNINEYKDNLMEELGKIFPVSLESGDARHWKTVLLGLAISYIQNRYNLVNPTFDDLRVSRSEFIQHIEQTTQIETEQSIVGYLIGVASEEYGEIVNHNQLTDLQANYLYRIFQNTVKWIRVIGGTIEGQYKLLNTLSKDDIEVVSNYKSLSLRERIIRIAEIKESFIPFIEYLWKIMIDVCQEKIMDVDEIESNIQLFNPCSYINETVSEYVCFNFPDDRCANYSVILPSVAGGNFRREIRRIVKRMIDVSHRPEKWMFENSKIIHGKNYYDYSTADVAENPTVADLEKDYFYIECMDCIGIDDDEWSKPEQCGECIFAAKCVKEGI